MVLLDLLGRKKCLRILWELSQAEKPMRFRELQSAAETNPTVLNSRLKELREAFVVRHGGEGYGLTEEGFALLSLLLPIHRWAEEWARSHNGSDGPD
jgi:DNA-binding HxlR family transcriptional regulator